MICLECSGAHRGLGVHLSFVRSLTMDSWTPKQVEMMKQGGNGQLNEWWEKHGIAKTASVSAKYGSPAASLYKDRLVAKVEGKPLPTELPKHVGPVSTVYDTSSRDSMSAGGFGATNGGGKKGVEPMSGESESAYVARQRQLQAEARARMQAKFGKGGLGGVGSDSSYDANTGSYGGGGGGGAGIEAISGGLKRLGSGAVEVVGQLGDRETVAAATERVKDAWGGVVTRVSSLRDSTTDSADGGGWATIRGLGASIGARVSDVAQKLATPDEDDGFSSMLEERRSQLGTGKQMDGLGNTNRTNSSSSFSAVGIDDLLAEKPPRTSSFDNANDAAIPRSVSFEATTTTPPRKTALKKSTSSSSTSSQQKGPPPSEEDADFFASFGV